MTGTVHLPLLLPRAREAHKGHFGTALLVGGSRGMAGAVALAGMAALRGGAGLVRLAVPDPCLDTVAAFEPAYITASLPPDAAGRIGRAAASALEVLAEGSTAVALGPGLGRSDELTDLVRHLYVTLPPPMVVDADALNALAAGGPLPQPGGPRVLTPHPGEFKRLLAVCPVADAPSPQAAAELARRSGTVVVLKGHRSTISDGQRTDVNTTGNPGMASGGSGDVLTGLVAALLCQRLAAWEAARLGVFLHGLAGDLGAAELGEESLTASDLVRFLPPAFRRYRELAAGAPAPAAAER